MRNLIISGVRTGVQAAVAFIVAYLAQLDIAVDAVALETSLFAVIAGLVTVGLNYLSQKIPIVGKILSLGLTTSTPSY